MEEKVKKLKDFFNEGKTFNVNFRIEKLKAFKEEILKNYDALKDAFKEDYNKCEFDFVATELGMVISELNFLIKHTKKLARPRRKRTSLINFTSHGYIVPEPYGVCLIVSPWNYPLQLSLIPLVGAIATGNVVVLKLSANTPKISNVIKKIISNVFEENYVYATTAEGEEREKLFDVRYDYIFLTGSPKVAKIAMEKQAKFLTPLTLELGGKSPCIVDEGANIEKSAKRAVWGKFLNAGQTCVAPDYFLVHKNVKQQFICKVKEFINKFYYKDGLLSEDFTQIVNEKNTNRLKEYCENMQIVFGGNASGRTFEPTILDDVKFEDKIMQEEIFGPIMPIIEFENFDEIVFEIKNREKPLALYYFGNNKAHISKIKREVSFGGGCINDCIMHLTEHSLPFGGVGNSGMGNYHGKKSFEAFSHYKSILVKTKIELDMKYPPYNKNKLKLIKFFMGVKKRK